jgi:diguanylate cyclase (GGDEF)-like protein
MSLILVVEDEPTIRSNLQRLLGIEGFTTEGAENGAEALKCIAVRKPDLVLSDVMMPVMDGHALLGAMRSDPSMSQIPVILLTAMADRSAMRQGMNIGADDYLTKPFQRDELLAALRSRLERAAAQRAENDRLSAEARRLRVVDPVTDLPNREALLERLPHALAAMSRQQGRLALIVVGLEGFSRINDSLGHAAGDRLLRAIADRLQAEIDRSICSSPFDGVARLGGVLFAVTLAEVGGNDHVDDLARRLLAHIAEPVSIEGQELFIDASAGISLYPHDGVSSDVLLEHAETALGEAKRGGGSGFAYFAPEMNAAAGDRLRLHNDLHRAIERGELEVYYQPQLNVISGRIIGFEALIRWQHPELGQISPVRFIPIAEESGQIVAIGAWILEAACIQAKAWIDQGFSPLRMAVNLSARQFSDDDLCALVSGVLSRTGLPAASLELEITEGTAMQGAERAIAIMHRLKSLGVKLALDDFGTGYSSLTYLKRFPLDVLKVDQSFVRNITTDPGDAAITRAVVLLARSFSMSVITEGVETAEHLRFIADLGCEEYQGYFFSKPVPASEAAVLLGRQMSIA